MVFVLEEAMNIWSLSNFPVALMILQIFVMPFFSPPFSRLENSMYWQV